MAIATLVTGGSGFLGTHVMTALVASGRRVLNLSTSAPADTSVRAGFLHVDVRDEGGLERAIRGFRPDEVVHLAARTGFLERPSREGFEINVRGTENVARAALGVGTVRRFLLASSNVVDFVSHEDEAALLYGRSKVEAERDIASSALPSWAILRPCYAWGPWFEAPFRPFFLAIAKGRYVHVGESNAPKLMGYAGNMAYQIERLLDAPDARVHGQTFYLADDEPTTIRDWACAIAREMGASPPKTLPDPLVVAAARTGDALARLGFAPPLTSRRLSNMRRSNMDIPIDATRGVVGRLPFSMEHGIRETVAWLRGEGLVPSKGQRQ